ncbi:hypothetical protein MMC30_003414 [Trapelia coarctata]|nr:hypothetical protein [Trapelia coarctata]
MREAMNEKIAIFLEGLANGFADLDLATLQDEVRVSQQGVYAGIVQNQDVKVYIGSSYGLLGLQNRVFRNHLNPAYRSHDRYKALYNAMDAPGAVIHFILLAAYDTRVETPQVLLTEAVCASLFDTGSDMTQIGQDSVTYRRLRALENALGACPQRVYIDSNVYRIKFFQARFTIRREIAGKWRLEHSSEVCVEWEISDDTHPHCFAMANPGDEASRLGIKVSKIGGGDQVLWIRKSMESAVPLANTLYDLFTRNIVGKQYHWKPDRTHIFREQSAQEGANPSGNETRERKRVGLPFDDSEFIWGDRERLPGTRPDWLNSKKRALLSPTPHLPPVQPEEEEVEQDFVRPFGVWMRRMEIMYSS